MNMEIKIKNDGKKRAQSYEAGLELISDSTSWGYFKVDFAGYGADEYSAKQNLIMQMGDLINKLKKFTDEGK